jgi:hypothetical protein
MWIEPAGFREIHERGNVERHRLQSPDKWVPYGVGAIEGRSRTEVPTLAPGDGTDGDRPGAQPSYGPGEEPRPREGEPTAASHGELL